MDKYAANYLSWAITAQDSYLAKLQRSRETQSDLLARVILTNKDTEFGRAHGFSSITSATEFSSRVPIRSYSELVPWIERAASGQPAVLTEDPPIAFHRTSSTTGAAKKIPVTRSGVIQRSTSLGAHAAMLVKNYPEVLSSRDAALNLANNRPTNARTTGGAPWCFFSETDWTGLGFTRHPATPGVRAPWSSCPADVTDVDYYRLRLSIEGSLRAILTWFPASLLHLADTLEARAEDIVREVRDGTVFGRRQFEPNSARAADLERVFGGGRRATLRDVWPQLAVVECWKGATSRFYLPQVQARVGPEVLIAPSGYSATESPIAFPLHPNSEAGLLDVTCAYFEFIPADHEMDEWALTHDQLQCGHDYRVVLTTMSGLYRYALGDIVRVDDRMKDVPLLAFTHRSGVVSSLINEKFTEQQLVSGVAQGLTTSQFDTCEWTVTPVYRVPPHYCLLLESPLPLAGADLEGLAAAVDRGFANNVSYRNYRTSGLMSRVNITVLAPGTFAEWRSLRRSRTGAALPQQKQPVIVDSHAMEELVTLSGQRSGRD